ncbi:MAG TPA: hypothetical protein VNM72_02385 [Blastocatellia bacterium]|nr:hypothetical protein [Blastocatellia bacterium]
MKIRSTVILLSLTLAAILISNVRSSSTAPLQEEGAQSSDVINQVLFEPKELRPGQSLDSPIIDVSGFQAVSVNVRILNSDPNIQRQIFFGPFPGESFALARTDSFLLTNTLFTVTPVFGPRMFVRVLNRGNSTTTVQGFVYGAK